LWAVSESTSIVVIVFLRSRSFEVVQEWRPQVTNSHVLLPKKGQVAAALAHRLTHRTVVSTYYSKTEEILHALV
jgi:hypothetical protein